MKRLILLAILCIFTGSAFAQNTFISLYGGAGTSLKYSYDLGISGGLRFIKIGNWRTSFGAQLFYQGYGFRYDKEDYAKTNGVSIAGVNILNKTNYICIAPTIGQFFGKHNNMEAYLNVGAGFKMSGNETMRKWDYTNGYATGNYDSTIDTSPNINSMIFRIGCGMVEYLHMGGHKNWWFTFTEDFGFLTNSISKTTDVKDPSRTSYSPTNKINPGYISLQIGISHSSKTYYSSRK
jgi:hypothetical protein